VLMQRLLWTDDCAYFEAPPFGGAPQHEGGSCCHGRRNLILMRAPVWPLSRTMIGVVTVFPEPDGDSRRDGQEENADVSAR
jgi:hypothetical protein